MKQFHRCRCFYSRNIFLQSLNVHVTFHSKEQFLRDYAHILSKTKNAEKSENFEFILNEIESEIQRRKTLEQQALERRLIIQSSYTPKHADLWQLEKSHFSEQFLHFVQQQVESPSTVDDNSQKIAQFMTKLDESIYVFPLFNERFCERLVDELEHFETTPVAKGRPNTMNNYGVLLDELGFDDHFLTPLRETYLQPLAATLFPAWTGATDGGQLDSHKGFVVAYEPGKDVDLSYHYDNAEVTLNVCLGKQFTGGQLYFGPMRRERTGDDRIRAYEHRPGWAVLHRGQQMHGAMPIDDGVRYNLILWMRSSAVRNRACPMCDETPSLEPAAGFGDGFTEATMQLCSQQ